MDIVGEFTHAALVSQNLEIEGLFVCFIMGWAHPKSKFDRLRVVPMEYIYAKYKSQF